MKLVQVLLEMLYYFFACWEILHAFLLCRLLIFFKINVFKKFFQEHDQSVKQFGFKSGPTFCRAWLEFLTGCKENQQKTLVGKELMAENWWLFYNIKYMQMHLFRLTLCLLVSSADNLCKQFGPRSGPTKCRAWSGSKLFDTLTVYLKEFFEKVDFENFSRRQKSIQYYPVGKELKIRSDTEQCFLNV